MLEASLTSTYSTSQPSKLQTLTMGIPEQVPQPGPAKLTKNAGPEEWLEQAKQCKYLPELDMKRLCEIVKELLMEGEHLIFHATGTIPWHNH